MCVVLSYLDFPVSTLCNNNYYTVLLGSYLPWVTNDNTCIYITFKKGCMVGNLANHGEGRQN